MHKGSGEELFVPEGLSLRLPGFVYNVGHSHVRIHVCCPFLPCTIMLLPVCHFRCRLLCDISNLFDPRFQSQKYIQTADLSFTFAFVMLH